MGSRSPVTQLEVVPSLAVVLGIKAGRVFAHYMATGTSEELDVKAKGKASLLAVNSARPPLHRLAVATTNRKLLLFTLRGAQGGGLALEGPRELAFPDPVRRLGYYGSTIAVGYRREYNLLDDMEADGSSGAAVPRDVFGVKLAGTEPMIKFIPSPPVRSEQEARLWQPGGAAGAGGGTAAPSDLEGELLLSSTGHKGVFITSDGVAVPVANSPAAKHIQWAADPMDLAYCFPYILALAKDGQTVEVHSQLDPGRSVQRWTVPSEFDRAVGMCDGWIPGMGPHERGRHPVLVATPKALLRLSHVDFGQQVTQLLQQPVPSSDTAYSILLNTTPPGELPHRLRHFHELAGRLLLLGLHLDKATHHLQQAALPPQELLCIFPELQSRRLKLGYTPELFSPCLLQGIVAGHWSVAAAATHDHDRPEPGQAMPPPVSFKTVATAVLTKAGGGQKPPRDTVISTIGRAMRVVRLVLERRRGELGFPNGSHPSILLDTALMRVYCLADDMAALQGFLQSPTDVSLEDAQEYLKRYQLYQCLARLQRVRGERVAALELLMKVGTHALSEAGFDGVEDTVDILSQETDLNVLKRFLPWLLESEDERLVQAGMRALTSPEREGQLDGTAVAAFLESLKRNGPQCQQQFLEHSVLKLQSGGTVGVTALLLSFINTLKLHQEGVVKEAAAAGSGSGAALAAAQAVALPAQEAAWPPDTPHAETRAKLLTVLRSKQDFNTDSVWDALRGTNLLPEQVQVARRMGKHATALDLLVRHLEDHEGAEAYAQQVLQEDGSDDAFGRLLHLYFYEAPEGMQDVYADRAEELLLRHATTIDCRMVLKLLPQHLPVARLSMYLRLALAGQAREATDMAVLKSVLTFQRLTANCDMINVFSALQERVEKVDELDI